MKSITALLALLVIALLGYIMLAKPTLPQADLPVTGSDSAPTAYRRYETVTRVVDGDTFNIGATLPYGLTWSVRVAGIDTAEHGAMAHCDLERDYSARATALTKALILKSGNRVRLADVGFDKYGGRIDATVYLSNGHTLQADLLAAGVARPYDGEGPKPNWCAQP